MEKYVPKYSICIGPSMYPTMRSADNIITEEYQRVEDIKIGDVIIFPHPNKSFDVVHRIIKIKKDGVITRGDNNNKADPYIVKFEDIKSKITAVTRGKKTIKIIGGNTGYIIHKLMIMRKLIITFPTLRKLSASIANSKILNSLDPLFNVKIVQINTNKEVLKFGDKAIGKRNMPNGKWFIKFPYKYFINKEKLK